VAADQELAPRADPLPGRGFRYPSDLRRAPPRYNSDIYISIPQIKQRILQSTAFDGDSMADRRLMVPAFGAVSVLRLLLRGRPIGQESHCRAEVGGHPAGLHDPDPAARGEERQPGNCPLPQPSRAIHGPQSLPPWIAVGASPRLLDSSQQLAPAGTAPPRRSLYPARASSRSFPVERAGLPQPAAPRSAISHAESDRPGPEAS